MKNKLHWLEAAVLAGPFLALAVLWNRLPPRFPVHWNLRGEIDRWSSNRFELCILPLTAFLIVGLLALLPRLDPKLRRSLRTSDRMYEVLRVLRVTFALFFALLFSFQMLAAFGYTVASGRLVLAGVLALLVVLGNYLGNLRPNYFVGIRTPWTLENPETWRATHRLGGRVICFGALILLLVQFFVPQNVFAILFISLVLLLVAWSVLYSWRHFRTHGAARET